MTDMIARENESGPSRQIPKIDNLRPAHQKEEASNQPPAEMREQSLRYLLSGHGSVGRSSGVRELSRD
jgi:hypothetical protein